MSDTNAILDQAQAELRAGRKAEAWKLTAAIVKADPQNARAWRVLADISEKDAPERAAGYRAKAEAAEANARLGPPVPAGPGPGPTPHVQRLPSMEHPQPQQLRPQQGPPPGAYQQPPQYPASPQPPTHYQQPLQYAPQTPPATLPPRKRSAGATIIQVIIALLILVGAGVVISRGLRTTNRSAAPQSSVSATRTPLAITPEILTGAELDAHFDRVETALAATPSTTTMPLADLDLEPLALQSGDLPDGYSGAQVSDRLPALFKDAPAPAKVFDQRFQKSDEDAGGVTILLYEHAADLDTAYDQAVDGMLDASVVADIGDGAHVSGGTTATLDGAEGVFKRCRALVFVHFDTQDTDVVAAYMKRLDARVLTVACAAP